jgi:toxin ParE1/3/4
VIDFHRAARRELRDAVRWYGTRSQEAASRFVSDLDHAFERLLTSPDACNLFEDGYRYLHLRDFPYHIIFEVKSRDTRLIVAVAHDRRRPRYWRRRSRSN